jgi:hypothetical protein
MKHKVYLIVRADSSVRAVTRYPGRLRMDEVAFPIEITFPNGWGLVQPTISVTMPDIPTDPVVRTDAMITPAEPTDDEDADFAKGIS